MKILSSAFIPEANATLQLEKTDYLPLYSVTMNTQGDFAYTHTICRDKLRKNAQKAFNSYIKKDSEPLIQNFLTALGNHSYRDKEYLQNFARSVGAGIGFEVYDNQKLSVYLWDFGIQARIFRENRFFEDMVISLDDMMSLVKEISTEIGFPEPSVVFKLSSDKTKASQYTPLTNTIIMRQENIHTLLHETAHAYVSYAVAQTDLYQPHGSLFVRLASQLYSKYMNIDSGFLLESAKKYNLIPQECTLDEFMAPVGINAQKRQIDVTLEDILGQIRSTQISTPK